MSRNFLIKIILVSIIVLTLVTFKNLVKEESNDIHYKENDNKPIMLIMYQDLNGYNHYLIYDFSTKEKKEIYSIKSNSPPDGFLSQDRQYLYIYDTEYPNGLEQRLIKISLDDKGSNNLDYLIFSDSFLYSFDLYDEEIFMKVIHGDNPYKKNYNIAIYDINTEEIKVLNKEEMDLTINDFDYNPYNQKIYALEYSSEEFFAHQVGGPFTHRIVQFDKQGNRVSELFKTDMYIDSISVSNNGEYVLLSGKTKMFNEIYLLNVNESKIEKLIESECQYQHEDNSKIFECTEYKMIMPIFSPDEEGFFFLSTSPETNVYNINDVYHYTMGIYYYDFGTKEIEKFFLRDDNLDINFKIID